MTTTRTSQLVAALEAAYVTIRTNHPELPENMAFVVGTGLSARGLVWGHHRPDAWVPQQPVQTMQVAGSRVQVRIAHTGPRVTELFISGERLAEGAKLTFQTLLHECAHALGHARNLDHCSRTGWHSKEGFLPLAAEMGLEYIHGKAMPGIGFSAVTLREDTTEKYGEAIAALAAEINVYLDTLKRLGIVLQGNGGTEGKTQIVRAPRVDKRDHNNIKATCGCGHIVRMSRKVFEATTIRCDTCGDEFAE